MTAPEVPAVVIPDGIEPVEAYRCWTLRDGRLWSLNDRAVWSPGQPLTAKCGASAAYRWVVCRHGLTPEQAAEYAEQSAEAEAWRQGSGIRRTTGPIPHPPALALPDGYGFKIEQQTHDSPHQDCTCGIYAASDPEGVPAAAGNVRGKVKLWGNVVPGEKGVRAQYAYPSEFHVPAELADDPTLLAFGVPIIVVEMAAHPAADPFRFGGPVMFPVTSAAAGRRPRRLSHRGFLVLAIALNVASAVLNVSLRAAGVW